MHFVRILMPLVLLAALATPAAAGSSGDRSRARLIFREAQQHYKLAEYQEALDGFKETYRILEDPTLLFNIAQCYRQLNKKEEAIRFYRTYLHDAPNVTNRANVEEIIASLDKAVREEARAREAPPQSTIEQPGTAPPPGTTTPAPEQPAPPSVVATPEPAVQRSQEKPPVYKRWWLWTTVGVVVAAGVGVGLGIGLTRTPGPPVVATQDGTFHPF
jgi:tetratricopeptide (TPR) repeat protein